MAISLKKLCENKLFEAPPERQILDFARENYKDPEKFKKIEKIVEAFILLGTFANYSGKKVNPKLLILDQASEVEYFDIETRSRFRITIVSKNDKIYLFKPNGEPFYREDNKPSLFIIDFLGHIYTLYDRPHGAKIRHSSFVCGLPVYCAGCVFTKPDGELILVNNNSGHYGEPLFTFQLKMWNYFQRLGIPKQAISSIEFRDYSVPV
ncbi:MAG: hypothetical protein HZB76_02230 [Chlamydiae bacterium]|nr:hypothetical protein [Chlamydiota bacterium]